MRFLSCLKDLLDLCVFKRKLWERAKPLRTFKCLCIFIPSQRCLKFATPVVSVFEQQALWAFFTYSRMVRTRKMVNPKLVGISCNVVRNRLYYALLYCMYLCLCCRGSSYCLHVWNSFPRGHGRALAWGSSSWRSCPWFRKGRWSWVGRPRMWCFNPCILWVIVKQKLHVLKWMQHDDG